MPRNRRALAGYGEDILDLLYDAPDNLWGKWLKAPFERAAACGYSRLTFALMEAGAKGNGIIPAVKRGHRHLVRDLLEMGASPTAKDERGDAPIHLAAASGRGRIVRTLLIEGADADVNEPGRFGLTPLQLACRAGDDMSVRALLAAGACPRIRDESADFFCALDFAAWNGHTDVMKTLLGKGADVNARAGNGWSCLHQAAENGRVKVIQFLAHETGVDIDSKANNDITPLHLAASGGHLRAVNALVAAGADVNLRTDKEYHFNYGCFSDDWSALDFAARAGHVDVLQALVEHGADLTIVSEDGDLTPLHHAAAADKVDAIDFLIEAGVPTDGHPNTQPLHLAAETSAIAAITALVRHGADLHEENLDERGPLGIAAANMDFDTVKALLALGAKPDPPGEASPAILSAISSDSLEMCELLLRHGADLRSTNSQGEAALHYAARWGTVRVVDFLVKAGAPVNGPYPGSYMPLHAACFEEDDDEDEDDDDEEPSHLCETAEALLRHGAAVNAQDRKGRTPLHCAAKCAATNTVDLLLRAGGDETAVDKYGKTPADKVRRRHERSESILRLLNGAPADRAWRRRGLFILCRALPDKASPLPERTRVPLPRAAKRGTLGWRGGRSARGEPVGAMRDEEVRRVVSSLVGLKEEDIFRKIVCML